ncbi:MAG: hypothetical protein A2167_05495 [Planctomycetes bacterium RBG_13_46_10]|nr:MAG: hypothetical protein A2167_05495 [Planctomycetes bacterium RBG_13_46_10]
MILLDGLTQPFVEPDRYFTNVLIVAVVFDLCCAGTVETVLGSTRPDTAFEGFTRSAESEDRDSARALFAVYEVGTIQQLFDLSGIYRLVAWLVSHRLAPVSGPEESTFTEDTKKPAQQAVWACFAGL